MRKLGLKDRTARKRTVSEDYNFVTEGYLNKL